MNVYAPTIPRERKSFFTDLWQYKTGETNLFLAGDFNCIENLDLDKFGGNPQSGNFGINELLSFTRDHNLGDSWRITHNNDRIYTWNNRDYSLRSRLDRWYIPVTLCENAITSIRSCVHSDHSAVELKCFSIKC